MAMYQVRWSKDPKEPRSSYWYTLGGRITYASGLLKEWVGKPHRELATHLYNMGYFTQWLSNECCPNTQKFHKELLETTNAFLKLLGKSVCHNNANARKAMHP